ncbi:hypothetical protein [Nitrosomonas sp. Nm84]|uniref:hypothetical protein n=1 Tax=Nitrosomonas sp. Nm84 TaxID=200124 RepID=UPI000D7736A6|nr:hypothetical protein [Nitrosomonas sp. Nm84]
MRASHTVRKPKNKPSYEVINGREDRDDEADAQAAMRVIDWSGWIDSTIEGCWMQSDMSHRQNLKRRIIANRKSQLMRFNSRKHVSRNAGAIQQKNSRGCEYAIDI